MRKVEFRVRVSGKKAFQELARAISRYNPPLERAHGRFEVLEVKRNSFVDIALYPGPRKIGIPTVITILDILYELAGLTLCNIKLDGQEISYTHLVANLTSYSLAAAPFSQLKLVD